MVTLDPSASRGYGGADQGISEPDWALVSPHIGSAYPVVIGNDDLKVTVATGDRTVRVAAGVAVGFGVQVTLPTAVTLQLAAAPTGSNRWDAIVLRRDWTANPGGTSDILVVQNSVNNSKTLPAALKVLPGEQHDQLIALVQVSSNSTLPSAVEDLRVRASKIYTAVSLLALPAPLLGAEAVVGAAGTRYRGGFNSAGNLAWLPPSSGWQWATQSAVLSSGPGFTGTNMGIRGGLNPTTGDVQLDIRLRRTGSAITPSATGNFSPDILLATVAAPYRPNTFITLTGQYRSSAGAWYQFGGVLGADGLLTVYGGTGGVPLATWPTPDSHSARAHVRFTREV